jgi:hypothetical protein
MEIRNSDHSGDSVSLRRFAGFPIFAFLVPLFVCSLLLGCASPGEPTARKALVPRAVTDLAGRQSGNSVVLTFSLPRETIDHRPLAQPPSIEIYRDFEMPPAAGEALPMTLANPTLLVTIPAAMVDRYTERDQVRYTDSLQPDDFAKHPVAIVVYTVRTWASAKKASVDSNPARLRVYPAPDPIDDTKAEVTPTAVVLTWTPPQKDPTGAAPAISGYHIYRAEAERPAPTAPAAVGPAASETAPATPSLKSPFAKIGDSDSPPFRDAQAEFGKTYVYSVRSVVQEGGMPLESSDSNLLVVTPRDVFPPAAPQGLVVVLIPAQAGFPAHLELSWAVSPETDLAGYNVYRSEGVDVQGTRVNRELLLTPAFRDINVMSGHRYFYSVTAVDRSGNEGPPSAIVSGSVPAESQSAP